VSYTLRRARPIRLLGKFLRKVQSSLRTRLLHDETNVPRGDPNRRGVAAKRYDRRNMRVRWSHIGIAATFAALVTAAAAATAAPPPAPLPTATSRYNQGDAPGRYRDANGKIAHFALKDGDAPLYDGGGREIGRVNRPVMLNIGATKQMDLDGKPGAESYAWAWATNAGSGWIARDALADPPSADVDVTRNPKPPREADKPLVIDAAAGREKLAKLRHVDSSGKLPTVGGGNRGEHYAGRNPGERDYAYLLFAAPNVRRGGVAKDSLPSGSKFVPALDENGKPIVETMTMYRDDDLDQPVAVTFLYGRAEGGATWGWVARANVGER
jgi:hypothetical protein